MNKIIQKLENSWIFWSIFIIGFISIFMMFLSDGSLKLTGFLVFPLGIFFTLPIFNYLVDSNLLYVWSLIYYIFLGFLVSKIVRDKKFNTKLILLLLLILIITMVGCIVQISEAGI